LKYLGLGSKQGVLVAELNAGENKRGQEFRESRRETEVLS